VLRSYGLADALRSLASTAPIRISVTDEGIGRCSPPVEATACFCSAEAIQNAIKHAGNNVRVDVTVGRDRDQVHFAIADDGVGIDHSERVAGGAHTPEERHRRITPAQRRRPRSLSASVGRGSTRRWAARRAQP
jgi:signal transduction histidine kinase